MTNKQEFLQGCSDYIKTEINHPEKDKLETSRCVDVMNVFFSLPFNCV